MNANKVENAVMITCDESVVNSMIILQLQTVFKGKWLKEWVIFCGIILVLYYMGINSIHGI
jgi:hypothetical protein